MDDLLFLSMPNRPQFYSSDAVLTFRRLIAAGLVEIRGSVPRAVSVQGQTLEAVQRIELTDRGRTIIEAWKVGDKEALDRALAAGAGPTVADV